MPNTLYANVDAHVVSTDGGALTATVSLLAGTQATSTSTPCRVCYLSQLTGSTVVTFGISNETAAEAAASLGAYLPSASAGVRGEPLELPVDDVSKIYLSSSATCTVGISYRK
jgi:hypothetical protein